MIVKISYHPQFARDVKRFLAMYDKNEIENVSDDYIKYLLNTFNE